jgi:hypothetical protein
MAKRKLARKRPSPPKPKLRSKKRKAHVVPRFNADAVVEARKLLRTIYSYIEETYDHDDESGKRTNGNNPANATDFMEMVQALEGDIRSALRQFGDKIPDPQYELEVDSSDDEDDDEEVDEGDGYVEVNPPPNPRQAIARILSLATAIRCIPQREFDEASRLFKNLGQ